MAVLTTAQNQLQSDILFSFTHGVDLDARLYAQEIRVQRGWIQGLQAIGLFSADDVAQVDKALVQLQQEMDNGTFSWSIRDEDVHMHVEKYVTAQCGDLGKKMHVGRSRNDLIATTLRLFVADACDAATGQIRALIKSLLHQASQHVQTYMPGLTHLQHGQPIAVAHVMLAYAEAFGRDLQNLQHAKSMALATMPLGAAALAGTPLKIDLQQLARELGFAAANRNSYDAVGDRDFMLQALNAFSNSGVHLARLSEDVIYWSASAVGIATLPPAWSTGSSIMPNKRNPDVPELTRGRVAHMIGAQTSGHTLMRTVPTSYGSDLHELKRDLIGSLDQFMACLSVWPFFMHELTFQPQRCAELLDKGHILATEIADALVGHGLAFRDAYKIVAQLVVIADQHACQVHQLNIDDVNHVLAQGGFPPLAAYDFTVVEAIARRANVGGTAKHEIEKQIKNWTEKLA
ncbi:MAG TPA: argininosuccinate lyase [Alphaproteobacteria bacterium]